MSETFFKSLLFSLACLTLLSACSLATVQPTQPPPTLGAGFRYSPYGPAWNPGAAYWDRVGQEMASRFPGAQSETIWIVSVIAGQGTLFSFPGSSDNLLIHFSPQDENEEALTLFDQSGVRVWLQVEPSDAPVEELIRIMLERYGHHPCVIGVGVDVEWYKSSVNPEGQPVTDEEAAAWLAVARSFNPNYRLFLKHWLTSMMPPTLREGILFVDDSQQFTSLEQMVAEFKVWGETFSPAPVAFQFGYDADQKWWKKFEDPAKTIGDEILKEVPNTAGLYWVDFTVLQVFKP
jgi:hypothetical protein